MVDELPEVGVGRREGRVPDGSVGAVVDHGLA